MSCASAFGESATVQPCPFPAESGMAQGGPGHFRETTSLMNDIPLQMYGTSKLGQSILKSLAKKGRASTYQVKCYIQHFVVASLLGFDLYISIPIQN